MAEFAAKIRGLTVSYDGVEALSQVDMDLAHGRITALIGPSGCGKSTLIAAIAGQLPDRAKATGEVATSVAIHGPVVDQLPGAGRERLGKYVADPAAIDAVGLPSSARHSRLRDLTLPERQLAAIARLIAANPPLWLLDQPTSALDSEGTARIEEVLWSARQHHTILLVTHSLTQARRASDDCALMMAGRIIEQAPTAQLFVTPKDARTAAFVEGRRIDI